jgi:hypothetical protein
MFRLYTSRKECIKLFNSYFCSYKGENDLTWDADAFVLKMDWALTYYIISISHWSIQIGFEFYSKQLRYVSMEYTNLS